MTENTEAGECTEWRSLWSSLTLMNYYYGLLGQALRRAIVVALVVQDRRCWDNCSWGARKGAVAVDKFKQLLCAGRPKGSNYTNKPATSTWYTEVQGQSK